MQSKQKGDIMFKEVNMYVLRKGKNVLISSTNREKVLSEQFFHGGEITKEKVMVKVPAQELQTKRW